MQGILIIAPNWIGDAVMTQPLLAALKSQYPASTIDVLASTWVATIYRACSEVNDVIEANFQHKQLQWSLRKQLANDLRLRGYQACFILPNSLKSALIPWMANIPFRIGYRGELRFGLINIALNNPSKINRPPMVEHYLALSQLLSDGEPLAVNTLTPKLNVSSSAKQSIDKKLSDANIDSKSVFVFCPGAEYGPTKRWPASHFAELATHLAQELPNANIILLGSKSDHQLAEEILQQSQVLSKNP
jgi:heptosyltransferase-2